MAATLTRLAGLALLGGAVAVSEALAVLVGVEYRDESVVFPGSGGPWWRGVVDTSADTLSIYWWAELPASQAFAQPVLIRPDLSPGALVWNAVDVNNLRFDVPDSFGSGTSPFSIGLDWAFVSPVSALNMSWVTTNAAGATVPVSMGIPSVGDFYPGWGGARRPLFQGDPPTLTLVNDYAWNQTAMPLLPVVTFFGSTPVSIGVAESTGATVTPWVFPGGGQSNPSSVPEATLVGVWGLGAAIAATLGRRRR
jgi:hypothetical protein